MPLESTHHKVPRKVDFLLFPGLLSRDSGQASPSTAGTGGTAPPSTAGTGSFTTVLLRLQQTTAATTRETIATGQTNQSRNVRALLFGA